MNGAQMCIDDSKDLPLRVRLLETVSTVLLWLVYLGVASFVQSALILRQVGVTTTISHPSASTFLQDSAGHAASFAAHLLMVTILGSSVLFLWARYNQKRFRGRDRRRAPIAVFEIQLAEYYSATPEQIMTIQQARRLVMHHDADGRLARVRYRRAVSVVGKILAGKQGVAEAELGQISNAARIQDPIEVVDLVLHDPSMKVLNRAIDGRTCGIEARVAQISIPRHEPAHAGHR
jgi:poly-beta-1,6-N-acetyl-D-glucosamine biosynthesis protein PgaD